MSTRPATLAELRALLAEVLRYLWRLLLDSIRDLVRIPLAVLAAALSLLSAQGRPTREALLILLIDALREVVLIPAALSAAALDVLLAIVQPPRYFHATQRLGRRWARLLDRWFVARSHARRMRVLTRWHARKLRSAEAGQSVRVDPPIRQP